MSLEQIDKKMEILNRKYRKLALTNNVQHIDIHGKLKGKKSIYESRTRFTGDNQIAAVTSVAKLPKNFTGFSDIKLMRTAEANRYLENKLSTFTITTKVCSLYPGNDIFSKKIKNRRRSYILKNIS